MPAAKKNLVIEQRAAFRKRFVYRQPNKKPVNLTGFGARMQIRLPDGTLIADLSTSNGGITLGAATGVIDLRLSKIETAAMSFTSALYDLKLIPPSGDDFRLLEGKVTLSPGQTE